MHGAGCDTMMACVLQTEGDMTMQKLRMPVPQYVPTRLPHRLRELKLTLATCINNEVRGARGTAQRRARVPHVFV
jgi:hypothetical protein